MKRKPMEVTVSELVERAGMTAEFKQAVENCGEFHLKAICEPYQPLTIEVTPDGHIAVAHTFVQNGDVMRDPEIVFNAMSWQPIEITQDPVGVYRRARSGYYLSGVTRLANMMASNIREQFRAASFVSYSHDLDKAKPAPKKLTVETKQNPVVDDWFNICLGTD